MPRIHDDSVCENAEEHGRRNGWGQEAKIIMQSGAHAGKKDNQTPRLRLGYAIMQLVNCYVMGVVSCRFSSSMYVAYVSSGATLLGRGISENRWNT